MRVRATREAPPSRGASPASLFVDASVLPKSRRVVSNGAAAQPAAHEPERIQPRFPPRTVVVGFSHALTEPSMTDPEQAMRAAARIEQAGWRSAELLKEIQRLDLSPRNLAVDGRVKLAEHENRRGQRIRDRRG